MRVRLMETPLAVPKYRQVRLPTVAAELAPFAEVEINDENVEPLDMSPVDVAAFTAQPYNIGRAIQLAKRFRAQGTRTLIGGPHATIVGAKLLEHFDAVVVGELEGMGERLIRDLGQGRLGNVYRNERPPDLATCRLPRRDLQKAGLYYRTNFPIELSRGCPHRCGFCYGAYGFPTFRTRPLHLIEADLDQWDHGYIEAVDMHFAADRKHLLEVCRIFEQRRVWGWMGQATLRSMDDPVLLEAMARSGCKAVFVGMESIEERALLATNKGFNAVRDYRRIIRMMQDHAIFVHVGLIWGLDGASPDAFEATARFCEETGVYLASTNMLTLFPGTEAHEQAERDGRVIATDLRDYDGARVTIAPDGMSREEVHAGARRFMERFYSWPSIFRRSLQAGNHNIAHLWGFWGFNLAYRSYFERWCAQLDEGRSPWGAGSEAEGFPWCGGRQPWYYGVADWTGRLLTWGHHAWDRSAQEAGRLGAVLALAAGVVVSLLLLAGVHWIEALRWPVPFPGTVGALAAFWIAAWVSTWLVDRLTRAGLSGASALAGIAAASAPMLAALAMLPEHAGGWRFLCALAVLGVGMKAWDLVGTRGAAGLLKAAGFLLLWPGFDFSEAFRPDPTRELLVRHYPMMGIGWLRLCGAAALFPALFWLSLHGEQGAWLLLGAAGRLLLTYLLLRGALEWLTGYWRMVGCELPDPFGRRPFGPSPTALWRSWNRPYRAWLLRHVYLPLGGRERMVTATLGTFLFSGLAASAVLAPVVGRLPWEPVLFFLAQGALVVLEKRLMASSARRVLAAGTAIAFLALAPWLFALTDRILV